MRILAFLSVALFGLAAAARADLIQLRNGQFIFGDVLEVDEQGIVVVRHDTGGRVALGWSQVHPPQRDALQIAYGLRSAGDVEEVMIEADRVRLKNGEEVVGILVGETVDSYFFQARGNRIAAPKSQAAGPVDKVMVRALEVKTREQLSREKEGELDLETADGLLELARYLRAIHALSDAQSRFQELAEAHPGFHPQEVAGELRSLEQEVPEQAAHDQLEEIKRLRARHRWDAALALAGDFRTTFPRSKLTGDVLRISDRIESERSAGLKKEIVTTWHTVASKEARKLALSKKLKVEEVQEFLTDPDGFSQTIRTKVLSAVQRLSEEADDALVRSLWADRGKVGREQNASYGTGTFILGLDAARKGIVEGEEDPASGSGALPRDIQEKLKKYLENREKEKERRGGRGGRGGRGSSNAAGPEPPTPDDWWLRATTSERARWALAYYAEFGADMEIVKPTGRRCRTCKGAGEISLVVASNGSSKAAVDCPTCQRIGLERSVRFK